MSFWHSFTHGITSAFHTVTHGINQVTNTIASTVDPHLKHLEDEYKSLSSQYNTGRLTLTQDVNTFKNVLNDYRSMVASNGTLLICGSVYNWEETMFDNFLTASKNPPPFTQTSVLPADISGFITKQSGSNHIVNYLLDPVTPAAFGLDALVVSLNFGGIGSSNSTVNTIVNTVLEFSEMASPFGGAIIGSIIEGEIEYPKEINKLQGLYNQLKNRITQVNSAIDQLKTGIQNERKEFIDRMSQINAIKPASFNWRLTDSDPDTAYQQAMVLAVQEYAIIFRLRNDWSNYMSNNPQGTYTQFLTLEKMITNSTNYTAEQVQQFLWLIAQATNGSLYTAWVNAGKPSAT